MTPPPLEWISIFDRLPTVADADMYGEVLVASSIVKRGKWDGEAWLCREGFEIPGVWAWAPLKQYVRVSIQSYRLVSDWCEEFMRTANDDSADPSQRTKARVAADRLLGLLRPA